MTLARAHNRVPLTINSPWETISGFNLTAVRRDKRQGMKLYNGIGTICDSSRLDQFHEWKCARKFESAPSSF